MGCIHDLTRFVAFIYFSFFQAHYRGTSDSNAIERARQAIVPPRRRRIGRSMALQGSRPSRRLPRDRNEVDEILLNRRRGRRQPVGEAASGGNGNGWPVTEGNSMETESDSGSTAPDRTDECAARPCENPRTGTVEWIACDSCERWFHQLCVGIRHRSQVKPASFIQFVFLPVQLRRKSSFSEFNAESSVR